MNLQKFNSNPKQAIEELIMCPKCNEPSKAIDENYLLDLCTKDLSSVISANIMIACYLCGAGWLLRLKFSEKKNEMGGRALESVERGSLTQLKDNELD